MNREDEYYTVEETARILKTRKGDIVRQILDKELTAKKEGRRWRVPAHVVHARLLQPFYHVPSEVEEAPDEVQNLTAENSALRLELNEIRAHLEMAERTQHKLFEERDSLLRQLGEERGERDMLEQQLNKKRKPPWWPL